MEELIDRLFTIISVLLLLVLIIGLDSVLFEAASVVETVVLDTSSFSALDAGGSGVDVSLVSTLVTLKEMSGSLEFGSMRYSSLGWYNKNK